MFFSLLYFRSQSFSFTKSVYDYRANECGHNASMVHAITTAGVADFRKPNCDEAYPTGSPIWNLDPIRVWWSPCPHHYRICRSGSVYEAAWCCAGSKYHPRTAPIKDRISQQQ